MFASLSLLVLLHTALLVQCISIHQHQQVARQKGTDEIEEDLRAILGLELEKRGGYNDYKQCMFETNNCETKLGPNAKCVEDDKHGKYVCACEAGFKMTSPDGPCEAESETIVGNYDHWGDLSQPDGLRAMLDQWTQLIRENNASAIAAKYDECCLYLHQIKGIRIGREAIQQEYQEWFDQGTTDALVTIVSENKLGDDYFEIVEDIDILDNRHEKMYSTRAMVIFKRVGEGFQIFHTAEIVRPLVN